MVSPEGARIAVLGHVALQFRLRAAAGGAAAEEAGRADDDDDAEDFPGQESDRSELAADTETEGGETESEAEAGGGAEGL